MTNNSRIKFAHLLPVREPIHEKVSITVCGKNRITPEILEFGVFPWPLLIPSQLALQVYSPHTYNIRHTHEVNTMSTEAPVGSSDSAASLNKKYNSSLPEPNDNASDYEAKLPLKKR